MGFGGAKKAQAQQLQQLQLQLLQQNQQRAALDSAQANQRQTLAQEDARRAEEARLQEEQERGEIQKRSKLSIFDAIRTGPGGLLNEPKTGRLTLLGN